MVNVRLSLTGATTTTKALIDTGAPRSVFPRGIGDLLGITFPLRSWDADTKITIMGHDWPAMTETVSLELPPFRDLGWEAPIDFVVEEGLPFALLGYEGFLNRWAVSVDGYHGYFIVEPAEDFDAAQPDELFKDLGGRAR